MSAATYCVVDLETAIGDAAGAIAAPGERAAIGRLALHELVGGSILWFRRDDAGRFGDFGYVRLGGEGEDEPAMLRAANEVLRPIHDAGGFAVTFNGSHDFSVLRRRAGRHWLFSLMDFAEWPSHPGSRHLDMMRLDCAAAAGRWPNLVDAAAGFGIDATCRRITGQSHTVSPAIRKAEVDTSATAILLFFHIAFEERSLAPVARGWSSLAEWIARDRHREDHLRHFARHPFAALARDVANGMDAPVR